MKRVRKPPTPVRWVDICFALRMVGYMQDFSKSECLRVAGLLKDGVKEGRAVKTGRGRYLIVK